MIDDMVNAVEVNVINKDGNKTSLMLDIGYNIDYGDKIEDIVIIFKSFYVYKYDEDMASIKINTEWALRFLDLEEVEKDCYQEALDYRLFEIEMDKERDNGVII